MTWSFLLQKRLKSCKKWTANEMSCKTVATVAETIQKDADDATLVTLLRK